MSVESINGHNSGMLWGLLASVLLHVLVVLTLPGFEVRFDDQRDFLTVQIDSTSEPELFKTVKPEPEKVIEPVIPSVPVAPKPAKRSIQPQRQSERVSTAVVPPVPNVPQESVPDNIPVLQAPKRTSSVILQRPELDNPIRRRQTNNLAAPPRPVAPVEPLTAVEPVVPVAPKPAKRSIQPQRQSERVSTAVVPPVPNVPQESVPDNIPVLQAPKRTSSVILQRPELDNPIRRRQTNNLAAPPRPVAPVEPLTAVEPVVPVAPLTAVEPVVPVAPKVDRQLELEAVEGYRRQVHASLQQLLQADQRLGRSKVDEKHKGAKFKISISFDDQGEIIDWKVTEESQFKWLDNYYLKLIKRLVDKGEFPAPPVERLTTTVVTIPIEVK